MLTPLRDNQRRSVRQGRRETHHSFVAGDRPGPFQNRFGLLIAFEELLLPPGDSTDLHFDDEAEMLTYVHRGAVSQEDAAGDSTVLRAGEWQRTSAGRRIQHKESSVSGTESVRVFRISLRASETWLERKSAQKRFTTAQRRNRLCLVASPDGHSGSLRLYQDAFAFSAILDPGRHIVHVLTEGRSAWLHLVSGRAVLDGLILAAGDAVGISNQPAVSLIVRDASELILIDLGSAHRSADTDERHAARSSPAGARDVRTPPDQQTKSQKGGQRFRSLQEKC